MRVWSTGMTSAFQAVRAGSIPAARTDLRSIKIVCLQLILPD